MKFMSEYQQLIEQLLKSNMSFKVDAEKEVIEINDDIYVYVEEGWENEPESYSVGARFREVTFDLDEIDNVISHINDELDWLGKYGEGV
ncbi:hypothetical protein [Staphylococcus aureus]|uniref:hypothetical protein n=1 Tax=Staphylococcus aureus TaxID=1280 RepID=UPI00044A9CCD|nr:hypothetical protein [Staphylococcus aureus]EZX75039.1 hypothetical protein V110_02629 [Staphylococcus aureus Chi-8]